MMGHDSCRWTQPRLALLAGGELTGDDRRRVERHVITCGSCRHELESLTQSVALLHLAGDLGQEESAGAPSLWPCSSVRFASRGVSRPRDGIGGGRGQWRG